MFLIYNDQPPINNITNKPTHFNNDPPDTSGIHRKLRKKLKDAHGGHTKGIVLADKDAGFWLIHSVPKFPERGNIFHNNNSFDTNIKNKTKQMYISYVHEQTTIVCSSTSLNKHMNNIYKNIFHCHYHYLQI